MKFIAMNSRLCYIIIWLSRIHRCLGFGIQSPTDYQFVRSVVNEHRPYYAYQWLGSDDSWLERKLGLLYFRIANWRQPHHFIDKAKASPYIIAGCRRAVPSAVNDGPVELAVVRDCSLAHQLLCHCDSQSVMIVEDLCHQKEAWKELVKSTQVTISFDLYYCGILMFDPKRSKQQYIINF